MRNRRGCKVYILRGAGPWPAIPASVYYGAVNLDKVAQTANVTIYGATSADGGSIIGVANALSSNGATAGTQTLLIQNGVDVQDGNLFFTTDAPITGNGIAVYYDVDIR